MKKTIIYIFLLSLFTISGIAQEIMDLPKAISIGLENNFGIKINDRFIQIAENNNTWARAGKLPLVDLGVGLNNTVFQDNNPASFLQGEFYSGALNVSLNAQWVVYNGGRVKILKDQLEMAIGQQQLTKETEIHNLLRTIYQDYYNVLFQKERLIVLESSLELSRERLNYEETKKAFGVSNSFNIIQFENAVLADSTNVVNQGQIVEVAKRNLYNTLNIIGLPNFVFTERLNIRLEDLDVDKLINTINEDNYTLKSLGLIADLNKLNTQLQNANRLPIVSVSGSVGAAQNGFNIFAENPQTGEPYPFLWSNRLNANMTANASWNLFDGGVRKTDVQNALLQEEIDRLSFLEAQASISNQIEILATNYNNQKELLALSDDQLQLAERNLELTEERFKRGQLSSIDFRNIQNQYLNASFSKVNAIYNLIITKSEIDFLVGRFEN